MARVLVDKDEENTAPSLKTGSVDINTDPPSLCLRIAGPSILCIRRISFEDHWTEPWVLDAVFVLLHVLRDVCIEALGDPRHDFNYLLRRVGQGKRC